MLLSQGSRKFSLGPIVCRSGILRLARPTLGAKPILPQLRLVRKAEIRLPFSTSIKRLKSEDTSHEPPSRQPQTAIPDSDEIVITVDNKPHVIKRSYPSGKREKLAQGLTRLLSWPTYPLASSSNDSNPNARPPHWLLSVSSDAIHRPFTLPKGRLTQFRTEVDDVSAKLGHDPHISSVLDKESNTFVVVATCTTHAPHGLSLKDVKLADGIDGILDGMGDDAVRSMLGDLEVGNSVAKIRDWLIQHNEAAAKEAREDPGSKCAVAERG